MQLYNDDNAESSGSNAFLKTYNDGCSSKAEQDHLRMSKLSRCSDFEEHLLLTFDI